MTNLMGYIVHSINVILNNALNTSVKQRWMPHINLAWPFVPKNRFQSAAETISNNNVFKSLRPFVVSLDTFEYHQGSKYVALVPRVISSDTQGSVINAC